MLRVIQIGTGGENSPSIFIWGYINYQRLLVGAGAGVGGIGAVIIIGLLIDMVNGKEDVGAIILGIGTGHMVTLNGTGHTIIMPFRKLYR